MTQGPLTTTIRPVTIATARMSVTECEDLAQKMNNEIDRPDVDQNMPSLLVSARNLHEAITAARAGADLIDLKEPDHGPLGRCVVAVWAAVAGKLQKTITLCAALGEWQEWGLMDDAEVQRILANLEGFDFAKIGPGGSAADQGEGLKLTCTRLKALGPAGLRWIAVVYADQERTGALPRRRIYEMARSCGFQGILIDTFDKTSPQFWGPGWASFVRNAIDDGMLVAIAGGLTVKTMRRLCGLKPHWFAVRGAACGQGDRKGQVSYRRVQRLARSIDRIRTMLSENPHANGKAIRSGHGAGEI